MRIVDLRSDTKTKPTPEMRKAMANALVGDDMDGEDPTVNRLEEMAAEMMGKDAAILVSSGTMGNLVAILAFCQRGDEIIIGDLSHIYRAEAGGASGLGGIAYHPVPTDSRGMLDPDDVAAAVHPDNIHYAPTKMVAIENTNNARGGTALTHDDVKAVADVARAHEIPLHVDGARIFHAAVYLETPVSELVKDADTVSFCLSKGLGCPVGSLLCGSRETIEEARRWRKILGGATRQAGVIAAPGIVALETMIDRLAEDHANARKLARGLSQIPGFSIDAESVQTNLVFVNVTVDSGLELARKVGERGIKLGPRNPEGSLWRLVTHNDVTSDDIEYALDVIESTTKEHVTA